jgi:serine/threonine protein kinase
LARSATPISQSSRRYRCSSPQVRVVQHKQTRELYALKYINKAKCVKMKAVANIIQERRLLEEVRIPPKLLGIACPIDSRLHPPLPQIDHPFVVNLRYAFQDDENCFFVLDLMLGGDLRCKWPYIFPQFLLSASLSRQHPAACDRCEAPPVYAPELACYARIASPISCRSVLRIGRLTRHSDSPPGATGADE